MMKESLFNLIRKHHYNISIYTEEIFERRCQEEIIRSDEEKSSFVYLEFDFETINGALLSEANTLVFWNVFLESLSKNNRGSDILGFLEKESGLGLLLLDSKIEGWNRVKGRIEQTAKEAGFIAVSSILNDSVKPIVYPACIQPNEAAS